MNRANAFVFSVLMTAATYAFAAGDSQGPASAATAPSATPSTTAAEAAQFDFLLGDWTIEARPKVSGLVGMIHGSPRIIGTWTAKRSADGAGIDDELTMLDPSGNPIAQNHAHRVYDAAGKRWKISETDDVRKRTSESTAHWTGGDVEIEGRVTYAGDEAFLGRMRIYAITANGFHVRQDRSTDDGKTWEEGAMTIDATRTADSAH